MFVKMDTKSIFEVVVSIGTVNTVVSVVAVDVGTFRTGAETIVSNGANVVGLHAGTVVFKCCHSEILELLLLNVGTVWP